MTYHYLDPEGLAAEPNLNCHGGNRRPPRGTKVKSRVERSGRDPLMQVQPQGGGHLGRSFSKQLGTSPALPQAQPAPIKGWPRTSTLACPVLVPPKWSAPHGGLTSEHRVNLMHTHPHPHHTAFTKPTLNPNIGSYTKFKTARSVRAEQVLSSAVCIRGCGWFEFSRATVRAKCFFLDARLTGRTLLQRPQETTEERVAMPSHPHWGLHVQNGQQALVKSSSLPCQAHGANSASSVSVICALRLWAAPSSQLFSSASSLCSVIKEINCGPRAHLHG